jgi:hypothetical protein
MHGVEGHVDNAGHQLDGKSGQDQPGRRDPASEPFGGERAEEDAGHDGHEHHGVVGWRQAQFVPRKAGTEAT